MTERTICIISAISENGIIGNEKGLPWNIPEEYGQFLDQVRGNTVIMGRKSWEIFGADLSDTRFIVISSQKSVSKGIATVSSMEEAILEAKTFPEKIFIAGGAMIYKEAFAFANRMHLSFIRGSFSGDVLFPYFNRDEWIVSKSEEYKEFVYKELTRKK